MGFTLHGQGVTLQVSGVGGGGVSGHPVSLFIKI